MEYYFITKFIITLDLIGLSTYSLYQCDGLDEIYITTITAH